MTMLLFSAPKMNPLILLALLGAVGFVVLWALKASRESRRIAQEKSRRIGGEAKAADRSNS